MLTTKKQIEKAAPGWYADERCQGLALLVKPDGRRRWVLDYRSGGRQRRMTLGDASGLPASEALRIARRHRVAIDQGKDPLAEKEEARRADAANVTLTTFFKRYIEEYATGKKKPRSVKDDEWMFDTNIKDALGRIRVAELTEADVARLHRQITKRPAPILANRMLALMSTMMTCAERWHMRPPHSNPCRYVVRNREKKAHRFLSGEQLAALGKTLAEIEKADKAAEEYELPSVIAAIRLLLFTGCRRGEILELKWSDVDLENGLLDLPESKTGRKTIVLNAPARQVLTELEKQKTGEYVVTGRYKDKPLVGLPHAWIRIRRRAGLDGVRLHDLRHSYASTGAGLGASLPVIGALLGHTVAQTTARYAGVAADPRREAAERIGKRLESLLSPQEKAKVVAMKKRRRHG